MVFEEYVNIEASNYAKDILHVEINEEEIVRGNILCSEYLFLSQLLGRAGE